jgi:hypothetical protein
MAGLALRLARLADVLELFLELGDARADDAAVELELRLTNAALRAAARAAAGSATTRASGAERKSSCASSTCVRFAVRARPAKMSGSARCGR